MSQISLPNYVYFLSYSTKCISFHLNNDKSFEMKCKTFFQISTVLFFTLKKQNRKDIWDITLTTKPFVPTF